MARKSDLPKVVRWQSTTPREMKREVEIMLKSALAMPEKDSIKHIEAQAGLIFDKSHPSQAVLALRLSEAKAEHERLEKQLEALRRERRKFDVVTPELPANNEEKEDEEV